MAKVLEPRFLMLNGKNLFPGITYEDFLIDVINASAYFRSKCPFTESYRLVEIQSNGEDDVYSSTYQLDFKLLVNPEVMKVKNRNMPQIDCSSISEGYIFTYDNESDPEDVPVDNTLSELYHTTLYDFTEEKFLNSTIRSFVNNMKKKKNLFIYYPYEYEDVTITFMKNFERDATEIFKNVFSYRDTLNLSKDTFVCFKINQNFVILEWYQGKLIIRDIVNEILCSTYKDLKTYSFY